MKAISATIIRNRVGMDQIVVTHDVPDPCFPGSKFATLGWAPRGDGPKFVTEVLGIPLKEVIVQ